MLILMHEDGETDEDEFLILHGAHQCRTLHGGLPYWKYDRFTLENLQEEECEVDFRFKKQDIYRLAAALHLPDTVKCSNGTKVQSIEALCICLRRFAYPCRYADLVPRFGRPVPKLCMITNLIIDFLFGKYGDLLNNLNQPWLSPQHIQAYANAIHNKGAALNNCWGFIDGTVRPLCRRKENQRMVYNVHK